MKLFHSRLSRLLLLVLSAWLTPACRKHEAAAATTAPAAVSAPEPTPTSTSVPAVNLDKVRGAWLRQDGGYRLVIGDIGAEGHTKAEYFNPSPIKVAWARVRAEGGVAKVDVELRDTNYPGCLYKLTYEAAGDRLVGTYFQAQMQETYEIVFVRQP